MKRIISLITLITFLLTNVSFAQESANNYLHLAPPLTLDDITDGTPHNKNMALAMMKLQMYLQKLDGLNATQGGLAGMASIEDIKAALKKLDYIKEKEEAEFRDKHDKIELFFNDVDSIAEGFPIFSITASVTRHGPTSNYRLVFCTKKDGKMFTIIPLTFDEYNEKKDVIRARAALGRLPVRNTAAVDRFIAQEEGIDRALAYAHGPGHKKDLVREFKSFGKIVNILKEELGLDIQNPAGLKPIEEREASFVRTDDVIVKLLKENPLVCLDAEGKVVYVENPEAHSSNNAVNFLVSSSISDEELAQYGQPGSPAMKAYQRNLLVRSIISRQSKMKHLVDRAGLPVHIIKRIVHEMGVMCGGSRLVNDFDKRLNWYIKEQLGQDERATYSIVDLDTNLRIRDYAAAAKGPGMPSPKKVILEFMGRTLFGSDGRDFSIASLRRAYESYRMTREYLDLPEIFSRKILLETLSSLEADGILTAVKARGVYAIHLTPSGISMIRSMHDDLLAGDVVEADEGIKAKIWEDMRALMKKRDHYHDVVATINRCFEDMDAQNRRHNDAGKNRLTMHLNAMVSAIRDSERSRGFLQSVALRKRSPSAVRLYLSFALDPKPARAALLKPDEYGLINADKVNLLLTQRDYEYVANRLLEPFLRMDGINRLPEKDKAKVRSRAQTVANLTAMVDIVIGHVNYDEFLASGEFRRLPSAVQMYVALMSIRKGREGRGLPTPGPGKDDDVSNPAAPQAQDPQQQAKGVYNTQDAINDIALSESLRQGPFRVANFVDANRELRQRYQKLRLRPLAKPSAEAILKQLVGDGILEVCAVVAGSVYQGEVYQLTTGWKAEIAALHYSLMNAIANGHQYNRGKSIAVTRPMRSDVAILHRPEVMAYARRILQLKQEQFIPANIRWAPSATKEIMTVLNRIRDSGPPAEVIRIGGVEHFSINLEYDEPRVFTAEMIGQCVSTVLMWLREYDQISSQDVRNTATSRSLISFINPETKHRYAIQYAQKHPFKPGPDLSFHFPAAVHSEVRANYLWTFLNYHYPDNAADVPLSVPHIAQCMFGRVGRSESTQYFTRYVRYFLASIAKSQSASSQSGAGEPEGAEGRSLQGPRSSRVGGSEDMPRVDTTPASQAAANDALVGGIDVRLPDGFKIEGDIGNAVVMTDFDMSHNNPSVTPVKPDNLEAFLKCLRNDIPIIVFSGIGHKEVYRCLIDPIKNRLVQEGRVNLISKLYVTYNSGGGGFGFDESGAEIKYWEPIALPPEERYAASTRMVELFYNELKRLIRENHWQIAPDQVDKVCKEKLQVLAREKDDPEWRDAKIGEQALLPLIPDEWRDYCGEITLNDRLSKITIDLHFPLQWAEAFKDVAKDIHEAMEPDIVGKEERFLASAPSFLDYTNCEKVAGATRIFTIMRDRLQLSEATIFLMGDSGHDIPVMMQDFGPGMKNVRFFLGSNPGDVKENRSMIASLIPNEKGGARILSVVSGATGKKLSDILLRKAPAAAPQAQDLAASSRRPVPRQLIDGRNVLLPRGSKYEGRPDGAIIITDYSKTLAAGLVPLEGEALEAFVDNLRASDLFVVATGDTLEDMQRCVLGPVKARLKDSYKKLLDRLVVLYDSSGGAVDGNGKSYWKPKRYNPEERADITKALAMSFWGVLEKNIDRLGLDREAVMRSRGSTEQVQRAISGNSDWENATPGKPYRYDIVPPELKPQLGDIYITDTGSLICLEFINANPQFMSALGGDALSFTSHIAADVRADIRFEDMRYITAGPTYVDISMTDKKEGVLRLLGFNRIKKRLAAKGRIAAILIGDSSNDTHLDLVDEDFARLGINAMAIGIFVGKDEKMAEEFKSHPLTTIPKNADGGILALMAVARLSGRDLSNVIVGKAVPGGSTAPQAQDLATIEYVAVRNISLQIAMGNLGAAVSDFMESYDRLPSIGGNKRVKDASVMSEAGARFRGMLSIVAQRSSFRDSRFYNRIIPTPLKTLVNQEINRQRRARSRSKPAAPRNDEGRSLPTPPPGRDEDISEPAPTAGEARSTPDLFAPVSDNAPRTSTSKTLAELFNELIKRLRGLEGYEVTADEIRAPKKSKCNLITLKEGKLTFYQKKSGWESRVTFGPEETKIEIKELSVRPTRAYSWKYSGPNPLIKVSVDSRGAVHAYTRAVFWIEYDALQKEKYGYSEKYLPIIFKSEYDASGVDQAVQYIEKSDIQGPPGATEGRSLPSFDELRTGPEPVEGPTPGPETPKAAASESNAATLSYTKADDILGLRLDDPRIVFDKRTAMLLGKASYPRPSGVHTVLDLVTLTESDARSILGIGEVRINSIKAFLGRYGLRLGMTAAEARAALISLSLDDGVEKLGLSTRRSNALIKNHVSTIRQLLRLDEDDLSCLDGIGTGSITNIKEVLTKHGFIPGSLKRKNILKDLFWALAVRLNKSISTSDVGDTGHLQNLGCEFVLKLIAYPWRPEASHYILTCNDNNRNNIEFGYLDLRAFLPNSGGEKLIKGGCVDHLINIAVKDGVVYLILSEMAFEGLKEISDFNSQSSSLQVVCERDTARLIELEPYLVSPVDDRLSVTWVKSAEEKALESKLDETSLALLREAQALVPRQYRENPIDHRMLAAELERTWYRRFGRLKANDAQSVKIYAVSLISRLFKNNQFISLSKYNDDTVSLTFLSPDKKSDQTFTISVTVKDYGKGGVELRVNGFDEMEFVLPIKRGQSVELTQHQIITELSQISVAMRHNEKVPEWVQSALESKLIDFSILDSNSALVFSEKATFDNGLGVLLPKLARAGIRIGVVAPTDKEKALIAELNDGKPADQRIVCLDSVAEMSKLKAARYYYFKVKGDPAVEDNPSVQTIDITNIAKRIVDSLGRLVGITEKSQQSSDLYQATRKFIEAAA